MSAAAKQLAGFDARNNNNAGVADERSPDMLDREPSTGTSE